MVIKHILLDVDGVVLLSNTGDSKKISQNVLAELVQSRGVGLDLGTFEFKTFLEEYNQLANQNWSKEEYFEELYRFVKFNTELVDFVVKKGVPISILSNNHQENVKFFTSKHDFFNKCFLQVYSCDIGFKKPGSEIFKYALKQLNASPEECVFIDDREENVKAAKELGIHSICCKNNEDVFRELDLIIIQ